MSHRIVASALHCGCENPNSSLPIDSAIGLQFVIMYNFLRHPSVGKREIHKKLGKDSTCQATIIMLSLVHAPH